MLYNVKYKGGMLLFIKKNIRHEFTEVAIISNNKEIFVMSSKIDERDNTYIYFIYKPLNVAKTDDFWM